MFIHVWTELLRLDLLGPGNGHVTYLDHFRDWVPKKLAVGYGKEEIKQ